MACIEIDFDVLETNNPKKLMIGDTSKEWGFAEKDPAYLYITLPTSRQPKIYTFNKGNIEVYNSENLGLSSRGSCGSKNYKDLPDGVYKIKLQSSYEEHFSEKYYLKTDIIEREIAKKVVEDALNKSRESEMIVDAIMEVKYKLLVAKSFIMEGQSTYATRYYNEAVDKFKNIK